MATQETQEIDPEAAVKQFKEFIGAYNKITQMCFKDCIHDFTTRKISNAENSCSLNCLEKYLKSTQRISTRFQEHHLQYTDDSPYKTMAGKS
ncbi:mitochondrial import inner membrane translocase subunit Tim9-like [Saccostrea echinata]|uniref:mitochondrial import inner membrane translocase subunit Tim9-like n=1 Tax=Saccostrea echinata TaxID=191078 RepID=UPI002A7FF0E8|nr:mitochondrial import inner membrane translocase subunit Tim9-like [Saccostrea echinata]XP_061183519.1 mitochondrial import inner membrane translocase subunit Tim9-like [Saccostrea echinata]